MRYLVLFVSAVWLAIGITAAYAPESVPQWLAIEELGPWMKVLALVPLLMGLILFLAAPSLRLHLYLRVIGALAIIKGVFILTFPINVVSTVITWFWSLPIWMIRSAAFVSVALAGIVAIVAIISLFEEPV